MLGKRDNLTIGRTQTQSCVLMHTERDFLSFPGINSNILAKGDFNGGVSYFLNNTKSLTSNSGEHCCQNLRQLEGISKRFFSGKVIKGTPMRKCRGVSELKSEGSFDKGHSGLLLTSICENIVDSCLKVKVKFPIMLTRWNFAIFRIWL